MPQPDTGIFGSFFGGVNQQRAFQRQKALDALAERKLTEEMDMRRAIQAATQAQRDIANAQWAQTRGAADLEASRKADEKQASVDYAALVPGADTYKTAKNAAGESFGPKIQDDLSAAAKAAAQYSAGRKLPSQDDVLAAKPQGPWGAEDFKEGAMPSAEYDAAQAVAKMQAKYDPFIKEGREQKTKVEEVKADAKQKAKEDQVLPAKERSELRQYELTHQGLSKYKELSTKLKNAGAYDSNGVLSNAWQGAARKVGMSGADISALEALAKGNVALYMKSISGAAISEPEAQRLQAVFPAFGENYNAAMAKADLQMRNAADAHTGVLTNLEQSGFARAKGYKRLGGMGPAGNLSSGGGFVPRAGKKVQ